MQENNSRFNILITTKTLDSYTFLPATRKTFWLEHTYDPNAGRIIKDPIIGQPNIKVEFNPYNILDDGMMNLQIKVTNIGNVPIILDGMEIKYYYTNDNELEQKIYYQYASKNNGDSSISLKDYLQVAAIEMDSSKQLADTYIKTTFKSGTGKLNVNENLYVNIVVYNDNYLNDTYVLENDHSYQTNKESTFALNSSVNSTSSMVNASNIEVNSRSTWNWGAGPEEANGYFASFKVGEGNEQAYRINDIREFQRGLINYGFSVVPKYGAKSNISSSLVFTNNNLKAILESDIAYISGHGYFKGIIPIFKDGLSARDYHDYSQYLTADANTDVSTIGNNPSSTISENNIFSLNMKDHQGESINLRLKWLILGACSQLEAGYSDSYKKWVDVLKNNNTMYGILGYFDSAPSAGDDIIMSDFIHNLSLTDGALLTTLPNAWKKANSNSNWASLYKKGYDVSLDETMNQMEAPIADRFILERRFKFDITIDVESALADDQSVNSAINLSNNYASDNLDENYYLESKEYVEYVKEELDLNGNIISEIEHYYIFTYNKHEIDTAHSILIDTTSSNDISQPVYIYVDLVNEKVISMSDEVINE